MIPDFKVGEEVEFELGPTGKPRWNWEKDRGGNGIYTRAKVEVIGLYCEVAWFWEFDKNGWYWPQPSSLVVRGFSLDLFEQPGYVRRVSATQEAIASICTCNIQDLWNYGHNNCPERKK
jgi:hypothetical protein